MKYELRKLSINDDADIYAMLQEIPSEEKGFVNSVYGRSLEEYKQWLVRSAAISRGEGLEDWMVPQTTYWLYADDKPVGYGKLRHFLTEKLREEGGHIGYAVHPNERSKGHGTVLLKLLIGEAKKMGIDRILITVRNNNAASLKVAQNNNGKVERADGIRHYIWINCT